MKNIKKNKLTIIYVLILIIIPLIGGIFYKNTNFYIGSDRYLSCKNPDELKVKLMDDLNDTPNGINFNFTGLSGTWDLIELSAKENNRITIDDNSKINSGKCYTVILDSDYNIIDKNNELDKKSNIEFDAIKNEKYFVRVVGKNASGSIDIKINNIENLDVSHRDFFK
ncbi:hypothetical protein [Clostridium senegalense]|uniref:hypothetical protein n=1 Tax=Clostridium senegalense TaxID=1465809 RepID=UPI0002897F82|nr:hypothetical protein [Clostridium senegalense]